MKICAAQLAPKAGDLATNIDTHLELIDLAVAQGAKVIFFPELSLTGYEPHLAKSLGTGSLDTRFDVIRQRGDEHGITIGVGLPLSHGSEVQIGMVWFVPHAAPLQYAKQQLHSDEVRFFTPGDEQIVLEVDRHKLAPAICYESLQFDHATEATRLGADVYLASVAKPESGMAKAVVHYPIIARKHSMYLFLANSVGPSDNFVSVGQSAIWNHSGELLVQMDRDSKGIVMADTDNGEASIHLL